MNNQLREKENIYAKMIAVAVRNNLEEFHHKYLTDAQMKELNPLIRNAIYTALVLLNEKTIESTVYYTFQIPDYWEDCQLIKF